MATIKSIEEKAKAYDEALERAIKLKKDPQSVFYEYSPNEGDTICDYIFPELKESKDERMIQYFKDLAPFDKADELYEKYGFSHKDAIAWLEKQGKQKETLCDQCKKTQPSHSCQDITALGRCALEKQGEQKLTEFEKAVKQVMEEAIECGDTHNLKADADMLLSLVHKSADKVKPRYSTGDVVCDKLCTTLNKDAQPNFEILDIKDGVYICDNGSIPISQQDNFELVAKKIEQNPAWNNSLATYSVWVGGSEINDYYLTKDEAEKLADKYRKNGYDDVVVEEIEQKLAAWSEEDEEMLNSFLHKLEVCDLLSIKECIWIKNKFKALKQNTWKPSDAQMKALSDINVTGGISYAGQGQELINLYNALKKLRGE